MRQTGSDGIMIYLDNAATTMQKPECVRQAVYEAMADMGNDGRGGHGAALSASRRIYEARERISAFFGLGNPSQAAFTANATEALNTAVLGLFGRGDHVITTALEHNSVLRPLYCLEKEGMEFTILPADEKGNISYEEMEEAVLPNTKAIVCTHASNVTGNTLDINRIGALCRQEGLLFILDASQTAGSISISMEKSGVDILCFTGHKGLMGPQGTGGICVREGIEIRPLKSGGSGIRSFDREHPAAMPVRLEAGTLNGHGIAGLCRAIEFIEETGIEKMEARKRMLANLFYENIKDMPGIKIYGDFTLPQRAAVISLNLSDYDSAYISDWLSAKYDICTRPGAHCAPLMHQALGTKEQGAVRFSFSYYNTEEEVQMAVNALKELCTCLY